MLEYIQKEDKCMIHCFLIVKCLLAVTFITTIAKDKHIDYSQKPAYEFFFDQVWVTLDDPKYASQFDDQWFLAGRITIRKWANEECILKKLELQWKGPWIKNMNASLFHHDHRAKDGVSPTNNNLMSECKLNSRTQRLTFKFNAPYNPYHLAPKNFFYLSVTLPPDMQKHIKEGYFELVPEELPKTIKLALKENPLFFAFNTETTSISFPKRFEHDFYSTS